MNTKKTIKIMKLSKFFVFAALVALFAACDNIGTTSNPIEDKDDAHSTESDSSTKIDSTECYMLQEWNELGEPIDSYGCMVFDKKVGHTFDEAFKSIKSELDLLVQRMVRDEKGGGNYDAEKWELRQVCRTVKNSPNTDLIYTSIELYMFSIVYNAYTIVYQFCIIDSEGNIYHLDLPDDRS